MNKKTKQQHTNKRQNKKNFNDFHSVNECIKKREKQIPVDKNPDKKT